MAEDQETVDYKSNGKILSVISLDNERFQISKATINEIPLTSEELTELLVLSSGNLEEQFDGSKVYDEEFISHLRTIFFTLYHSKNSPSQHIPILLSIEGNIGAGKSRDTDCYSLSQS
jgi:hypothetical protein